MSTKTIEEFFSKKIFEIPAYQRDYAWTTANIDDLFEDIQEAIELRDGHYMGTFILSKTEVASNVFKVVDGQQRITTLSLLLDALIDAVDDPDIKKYYRDTFIKNPVSGLKLKVMGANQRFFDDLINDREPEPDSAGQIRLLDAYRWIRSRIDKLKQEGEKVVEVWLSSITNLQVLEFIEPDEGKAIRMFQSVNDRGVPLSKMDIAKSLLIYNSNRFIKDETLDQYIAERFGEAFHAYSRLRTLAAESGYQINLVNRSGFREDDVLRYHYLAFNGQRHQVNSGFDYNATSDTVLNDFLKPSLKNMRAQPDRMRAFIEDYVGDLADFFKKLLALVEGMRSDKKLYLTFAINDLAATLYPLTVRLSQKGILFDSLPEYGNKSLLELIEIADIRVFKLRGTNPQADIADLVRKLDELDAAAIGLAICNFIDKFMDDALFEQRISVEPLYRNPGTVRILLAVEELERRSQLTLEDLVGLRKKGITVEHILPQQPSSSFNISGYGFTDKESYEAAIHRIGNLTLLESGLNSSCSNATVEAKVTSPELYRKSKFSLTANLAASAISRSPAFSGEELDARCRSIAKMMVRVWPSGFI